MRIVLTGSGSGGHFYPLIAVAEALNAYAERERMIPPELYLLGPDAYDSGSLFAQRIQHIFVPAGKVRRYFSVRNGIDAFKTMAGVWVAFFKLLALYPDAVLTKGSYTSMPVVIAAWLLRIPIVVHESDVRPGRANKLAARFARIVAVSYEESLKLFPPEKTIRTGIPVRARLLEPASTLAESGLALSAERPFILVLGGSQGAERVNDLIITALDQILPEYSVLHQTGDTQVRVVEESARALVKQQQFLDRYQVRGFLGVEELHAALAHAALVISRAGSGSIYEIALHGKPSILIPIPQDISHDQRINAYEYARTGAATVMEERNLTPHLLAAEITRIMGDRERIVEMSRAAEQFAPRDAAQKIATLLVDIAREHSS